jgi:ubiquinone/menaquinone biosynthesis C-methylase UbiE
MAQSDKFWDKTAEKYSKSPISDDVTYQKKLAETQSYFRTDMRIVEFGCGTGSTAIHHAPHVQHIDAIDISNNMLEIGRSRASDAGVENITFTCGDLIEFNAEAASLDAVLGMNVLHLLPNLPAEIAEVARILKPGGVFVSSTACLKHSYLRFIKLIAPLGKLLGIMPDVFVLSKAELTQEITDAGFEIEHQWQHGKQVVSVFLVARKI